MSDYKDYRPRTRISARVLTSDISVPVIGPDNSIQYIGYKAGDYEIRADDGKVSYELKADFDGANEPVRRERQATSKASSKTRSKPKDKVVAGAA